MLALLHSVSPSLAEGERTFVERHSIDFDKARQQHAAYERALIECGATTRVLDFPAPTSDAVFVEDTAIVLDVLAVLCSMGAPSRRAETAAMASVLAEYRHVVRIELPATLEGGDVLRIGRTLLVGQSSRTNAAGIEALSELTRRHNYEVRAVPVHGSLHLKTACTALPDGRLLLNPAWLDTTSVAGYPQLPVPTDEPWGANIALVGGTVIASSQSPRTSELIERQGFKVRAVDLSEFAKAEGGVTCLSLLIP